MIRMAYLKPDPRERFTTTCREHGLSSVYAFGNHATIAAQWLQGETCDSKLDLSELNLAATTEADVELSTQEKTRLETEFEALFGFGRVRLVMLWELDSLPAVDVIRGELLYCADPDQQARDELYILGRAADAAIFHRKSLADIHGDLQGQRWTQTVEALNSVERGEVVPAEKVHTWLKTWGQDSEIEPPTV